jgi:cation diffusion facilitator CzcD-associated flavoprotein CzcO
MTQATRSRTLDLLIVGAGQAGLTLGHHLKTTRLSPAHRDQR